MFGEARNFLLSPERKVFCWPRTEDKLDRIALIFQTFSFLRIYFGAKKKLSLIEKYISRPYVGKRSMETLKNLIVPARKRPALRKRKEEEVLKNLAYLETLGSMSLALRFLPAFYFLFPPGGRTVGRTKGGKGNGS